MPTDGRGTHAVTVGLAGAVESDTTMTGAKLHHTYGRCFACDRVLK
jgi:hypothetical protein